MSEIRYPLARRAAQCASGTHRIGEIECSYASLVDALGEPDDIVSGDGKITTNWCIEYKTARGKSILFTIHDYKDTSLYSPSMSTVEEFRQRLSHQWSVGGFDNSEKYVLRFLAELQSAIGVTPLPCSFDADLPLSKLKSVQ